MAKLYFENNQQYKITLPKALVQALGWQKGDSLGFRIDHVGSIIVSRVGKER